MDIGVEKAFPVHVNVGGKQQQVWTTSTTVADFLKQQGIQLGQLDRIEPSLHEMVKEQMTICVVRVKKRHRCSGRTRRLCRGDKTGRLIAERRAARHSAWRKRDGSKTYEVTLENGKETARKLIAAKTLKESKARIVAIGTKTVRSAAAPDRPSSRGSDHAAKEFYVTATAYTAYCAGCSGITSTGINLRKNPSAKVIAVDPSIIPLGSKVYVEGYGYAIAADTGSGIRGYKIDVFFPERSDAFRWGRKRVKIRVLP